MPFSEYYSYGDLISAAVFVVLGVWQLYFWRRVRLRTLLIIITAKPHKDGALPVAHLLLVRLFRTRFCETSALVSFASKSIQGVALLQPLS